MASQWNRSWREPYSILSHILCCYMRQRHAYRYRQTERVSTVLKLHEPFTSIHLVQKSCRFRGHAPVKCRTLH